MTPNAPQTPEEHVRIHNHCGACGQLFVPREGIIIACTTAYPKQISFFLPQKDFFTKRESKKCTINNHPS